MNSVYILLGSNIEKEANIVRAFRLLGKYCKIIVASSVYETSPVGMTDQPNFYNAVIHIETTMGVRDFKHKILTVIEERLNRSRSPDKCSPRTIDADIILVNDKIIDFDHYHIPDPDLKIYPHIAVPLAEIAPNLRHPETAELMSEIAAKTMASQSRTGDNAPIIRKQSHISLM